MCNLTSYRAFTFFTLLFALASSHAEAETVRVAVASNFLPTLQKIGVKFEDITGHQLKISGASTGKLYAQIIHGAPYDVFLAADAERPELLDKEKHITEAQTYAFGRLVFVAYTEEGEKYSGKCMDKLLSPATKRVVIANPKTAPYGLASKQALESLGLWKAVQGKLVRGENISQALQFIDSRNAQAGFIAKSQFIHHSIKYGCQIEIDEKLHAPIEQKMIKINNEQSSAAVDEFWKFMTSEEAQIIMTQFGYEVPKNNVTEKVLEKS